MFPILTKCPLFRGLDTEALEELLEHSSYLTDRFHKGDIIARRDTAYSGLMIILEGSVHGEMTDRHSGKRVVIDMIPAGQLIAPAFLFGGYNRLPIDVVANEDTLIMVLHRGSLFEMMQDNTVILSNFIDIISNRANYFSRKIYALTVLMLKEKVAAFLLGAACGSDTVKLDIAAIADAMDVTRLNIEQTLAEIERKGAIKVTSHAVQIVNLKALESLAY